MRLGEVTKRRIEFVMSIVRGLFMLYRRLVWVLELRPAVLGRAQRTGFTDSTPRPFLAFWCFCRRHLVLDVDHEWIVFIACSVFLEVYNPWRPASQLYLLL